MTKITFICLFLLTGCALQPGDVGQEDASGDQTLGTTDPWVAEPSAAQEPAGEDEPVSSGGTYAAAPDEPTISASVGGTTIVEPAPSTGGTPVQVTPETGGSTATGGETADPVEPDVPVEPEIYCRDVLVNLVFGYGQWTDCQSIQENRPELECTNLHPSGAVDSWTRCYEKAPGCIELPCYQDLQ